ncbi:threonylcarbamoyl-AMP synthase [Candidatus Nomurabacteria bacterium]|nr:threonylcarbamoyl-AMP synthase [Candidatus Nomurabacteria bacterium]
MKLDWQKGIKILKSGGVGVVPTDTLYGLVASTDSKKAVEKIYKIKDRDKNKALIVLIHSLKDLEKFGIKIDKVEVKILKKFWPREVSILLPCRNIKFKYIHRGTGEIAFRMIGKKHKSLHDLIKRVGPIVAPSANKESDKPAGTIKQAREYFGDNVDFYINYGKRMGEPSTLIRIKNGSIEILRQGKVFLV